MDDAMMRLLAPYFAAEEGQPIEPAGMDLMSLMSMVPQGGGGGGGNVQPYQGGGNRWEQLAAQMAQNKYGWGPRQFAAIDKIATAESGWNPGAVNPSSGAAGIPQALPSAHPGLVTNQWMHDPRAQIAWMLNYIKGRYGTPVNAWQTRQTRGWY